MDQVNSNNQNSTKNHLPGKFQQPELLNTMDQVNSNNKNSFKYHGPDAIPTTKIDQFGHCHTQTKAIDTCT